MATTPRVPASVSIDGLRLAADWQDSQLTALDGFTIKWGRDDMYDNTPSAQLVLDVIDPDGAFAGSNSSYGKEVIVTYGAAAGTILYRGTINDLRPRPLRYKSRTVWHVRITCNDVLADLARTKVDGLYWTAQNAAWDYTFTYFGANKLFNRETPGFVWLQKDPPGSGQAVGGPGVAWQLINRGLIAEAGDIWTYVDNDVSKGAYTHALFIGNDLIALDMWEAHARLHPVGHTNWNPATRRLGVGSIAKAGQIALTRDAGGSLRLSSGGANRFVVPAQQIVLGSEREARSTVAQNITSLSIPASIGRNVRVTRDGVQNPSGTDIVFFDVADQESQYTYPVPGTNQAITSQLEIQSKLVRKLQSPPYNSATDALASTWMPVVQSLNGVMASPNVTFDLTRWNYGAAVETAVLTLMSQDATFYFAGSQYNQLEATAKQHQIIGGTITYRHGFKAEVTLAPAISTANATLTVGQLVTNPTPKMGDYDPAITLADLGNVSIGLN